MSSVLYYMVMGIFLFCSETDGGSLTWNEPLPIQNIPDNAIVEHTNHTTLLQGTNASLTWRFSLSSDLSFDSLTIRFDKEPIAGIRSSGQGVISGFEDKYGITWIPSQRITLAIFNVTTAENGTFVCEVTAAQGLATSTWKSNIEVDLLGPPSSIAASNDQEVRAPTILPLECSASGNPEPSTTWTRLPNNTEVKMPLNISGGQDIGTYRCTADNGFGTLTKDVFVNVLFGATVTLASKFYVEWGQTATLICKVEGNPSPSINWSPCGQLSTGCNEEYLRIPSVKTSRANYTCTSSNDFGQDSETTILIIGGKNIYLRISISAKCDENVSVWETLQIKLRGVFVNTSYIGTRLRASRCGSLIFDLILMFRTEVGEDDIIDIMKIAVSEGKFGDLRINVSSIIGIPPVIPTTATSSSAMSTPKSERNNIWIIVGAVLGAVALVVIIAVIVWCVRKKKCSNETKEVSDGNDAGQGKGGGAQGQNAGDESAYDSAYSNATVLPPSKKPANTVKEDAGQAIALPVYAQVDKSKKKPRSEKEAQRQPGELLYVQADHSNEGSLPTKASGNPSRPPPYQDTVYADLV